MSSPNAEIDKYDTQEGFYFENKTHLSNIYSKCLKRFNKESLFDYERNCVENYSKMLLEAIPIVRTQLINDF